MGENMVREQLIEKALKKKVEQSNGLAIKFISPSLVGIPDRLLLMPNGIVGFVEVKRPGGKLRRIQKKRIQQLTELGFKCFILDDIEMIDLMIKELMVSDV